MNWRDGGWKLWTIVLLLIALAGSRTRRVASIDAGRVAEAGSSGAGNVQRLQPVAASPSLARTISQEEGWQTKGVEASPLPAFDPVTERKFAQFADWARSYVQAASAVKPALKARGLELARRRRDELSDLIQAEPKRALELAVPVGLRRQLPEPVRDLLEERVSGLGDLLVLAALPEPGREGGVPPVSRTAEIGGMTYRAYVYGRRLGEPTRQNVRLNGIALDGLVAIEENPARVLDAEEVKARRLAAFPEAVCAVDGQPLDADGDPLLVEAGGEIFPVCDQEHAGVLNERLIAAESGRTGAGIEANALAASPWTEGIKTVIVIRVDFSDLTGEPLSQSTAESMIRGAHAFYQEMSYGKAGFALIGEGSEVTPTLRLPRTAAYYGANDVSRLRNDARTAARSAGYDLPNYALDLICFGLVPGFKFTGMAYVGIAGAWLRDNFTAGVAAHELGHNFGLNHANFWDTSGRSVIGSGSSVEYGDKFDTMGTAGGLTKHFNARYKNLLNWLPNSDVITVTENGAYRIFAHDEPETTGPRALKIRRNSNTNYWVEFRQKYPGNKWLADGVGLRWAGNSSEATRLLDTTPGSAPGKDDSPIVVGRTFSDRQAGIHITALGKSDTTPASIEVVVQQGSFPDNKPPVVTVAADAETVPVGTDLEFRANAADSDGDALAYFWDFGDGNFGSNQPRARHRWNSAGEYVVRCIVSDMKGGQASDSMVVRIGSPTTHRLSGRVTIGGKPLEGVRVYVSSRQMTYTDSDGRYTLVALVPGLYTINASLEEYVFVHPGFLNPVRVGPSMTNVDFLAVPPEEQNTTTLVPAGSVWRYLDDGSNQGVAWRGLDFDDGAWEEGPAPLGYGDDSERTVVRFGPNSSRKYVTTYFRRKFVVAEAHSFSGLTVGLLRDDGGVVYLNGREVFRSNLPAGEIAFETLASSTVGGAEERTFFHADLDPAWLESGTNLLAVEIHQASRGSSDIAFDLELIGTETPGLTPPALVWDFTGYTLRLSWPEGPTAWILQSAFDLTPSSAWSEVAARPAGGSGQRSVTVVPTQERQFYRLTAP